MSPVLIVGALLGQMKLVKPLAKKAAALFGLIRDEERMLNEVPYRGTPMPPTDPLIYRFYELVMGQNATTRIAASVAIGMRDAHRPNTSATSSNVTECIIPATGVRPPALIFVAVRAIAPVAGIPSEQRRC